MFKRFLQWPGLVFGLVFAWKVLLLVLSAQPVPAGDAFFYDGPVVNLVLHGKYVNPSLVLALPTSATQVFSAYPPLYQWALLPWMLLFGTSALSAMAFHLVLFGLYSLVLLAIFRRLNTPAWCVQVAGAFLFLLTFDDRPDSLAHVLGMLAVYAWVRSRGAPPLAQARAGADRWTWAMVAFIVLSLGTSLQIGSAYALFVWAGVLAATVFGREKFPALPLLVMVLAPVALVGLVALVFPHLWAGFLEHARQTPSLTGWRRPSLHELLRVGRAVPGVFAVTVLLPWVWRKRAQVEQPNNLGFRLVVLAGLVATLAVVGTCLLVLTSNMVLIAGNLQPLLVGSFLALTAPVLSDRHWLSAAVGGFLVLALVGSIRAVGMSTWGLACTADVGYPEARQRVERELAGAGPGQVVVLSSAYLYDGARYDEIRWIHADWLHQAKLNQSEAEAFVALKPAKLVVTQCDYYRKFQEILVGLKARPELVKFHLENTAKVPPPDSIPSLQKVVQHISWAPVIVTFVWQ